MTGPVSGARAGPQPPNHGRAAAVQVRPAEPPDYPAVAQVTLAAYRGAGQVSDGHPYEAELTDVTSRAAAGELLVAEYPGSATVVGAVLFVRSGSEYAELCGPDEAEFRMLAVDPAAQGRGVGQALVRACQDRAAALGCRAVVIYTRDFAAAAHRLYAKFGFVRTPERDWTPHPGVDLWAMRLDLPGAPAPAADPAGPAADPRRTGAE